MDSANRIATSNRRPFSHLAVAQEDFDVFAWCCHGWSSEARNRAAPAVESLRLFCGPSFVTRSEWRVPEAARSWCAFAFVCVGHVHGPEHRGVPASGLLGRCRPADFEQPAAEFRAVQRLDGGLGLVRRLHLYDAETGAGRRPVTGDHGRVSHDAKPREEMLEFLIVRGIEVSDK
jgi:hypothetical protein